MGTNQSNMIQDEVPEKVPPPKIPRLYMSVVRKRTLKISVYDYPEHLNPFREEEEIERRAAQAALEGRTSRCHLLPMSPYSTLSRSPKPRLDLSPPSSGASTPVNGTLRRRMKRRAPLPPPLSGGSTPTSVSPAYTPRSRPATPPSVSATPPESPLKQSAPQEDEPKLPSDFQEPAAPTSQAEPTDQEEIKSAAAAVPIALVNGEVARDAGDVSSTEHEPRELPLAEPEADASVRVESAVVSDTNSTTIPREHDPPADPLVQGDTPPDAEANTTLSSEQDPSETPPQADVTSITQETKEEEIERLNKTERPAEETPSEINNIDVENNNSKNILVETNPKTDENETKSNLDTEDKNNDKVEEVESQIEINENKDDIKIIENIKTNKVTDEAFQDNNILEESNNIKNCSDEKRDKILTSSEERELPYIDQDSTSKCEAKQNDTGTISNGHSPCIEDEVKHNGHEEMKSDAESTELAPSPLPRRSKSPNPTSNDDSPSRKFTPPMKPSQDKYAKQVSHYEIKITDVTDI